MSIGSVSPGATTGYSPPPTWLRVLLGAVLVLAGLFVLGDVVAATLISAMAIGIAAVVAGAFEVIHAFWTKGWGGFVWQILLGILYLAFGFVLISSPLAGALMLTYALGLILLASGILRVVISVSRWTDTGWIMLVSGILGIIAGLIILTGWPVSGLWVLGTVLGVDLVLHGIAWLTYAWMPVGRTEPQLAGARH